MDPEHWSNMPYFLFMPLCQLQSVGTILISEFFLKYFTSVPGMVPYLLKCGAYGIGSESTLAAAPVFNLKNILVYKFRKTRSYFWYASNDFGGIKLVMFFYRCSFLSPSYFCSLRTLCCIEDQEVKDIFNLLMCWADAVRWIPECRGPGGHLAGGHSGRYSPSPRD